MMIVRGVLILGLLLLVGYTGSTFAAAPGPESRVRQSNTSGSGNEIGGLSFSDSVDERARPIGADVDFSPETMRLWVSFNYYDFKAGSRVHYVVKAHGEDLMTGDLTCCEGANGRYAFPLEYERDRAFGGAAYEVIIVVGKTEASRGMFVVRGTGGFDNDNCDNADRFAPRGNLSNSGQDCS